jgi:hypothetical protein
MKYFYFGELPIFHIQPKVDRVNVADTPVEMIYVSNIKTTNYYVLKSYDFSVLLCHATTFEHLNDIIKLRRANGMLNTHIIVTRIEDRAEVLFNVDADTDLGITVHFLDDEQELEKLLIDLIRP